MPLGIAIAAVRPITGRPSFTFFWLYTVVRRPPAARRLRPYGSPAPTFPLVALHAYILPRSLSPVARPRACLRYTDTASVPVRYAARHAPSALAPPALTAVLGDTPRFAGCGFGSCPKMASLQQHGSDFKGYANGSEKPVDIRHAGILQGSRHLFITLTFDRSLRGPHSWCLADPRLAWLTVRPRFLKWWQSLMRLYGGKLAYLCVVEKHTEKNKQVWPHLHVIAQSPHGSFLYTSRSGRDWIEWPNYRSLRDIWPYGHADYQIPMAGGSKATRYIRKTISYMRKSGSSCRTLNAHINGADPALAGLTGSKRTEKKIELMAARIAASSDKDTPNKSLAPVLPATFRPNEMGLPDNVPYGLRRFSWSHDTPFDWSVCYDLPDSGSLGD